MKLSAAGPWCAQILLELKLSLRLERQVQLWFDPVGDADQFARGRCPIYCWDHGGGSYFYGFPASDEGIKVAHHHNGEDADPDALRQSVDSYEIATARSLLQRLMPNANGPLRQTMVCMYTNTPDGHFLIDRHPQAPQVLILSPCSGHGFKFPSIIGEIVADLIIHGECDFDLSLFGIGRL